jgi:predicted nucleic acid-binding protein
VSEAYVLDSFAILALLGGEPGANEVARLLREAQEGRARLLMTWVNLGEVAYIVERRWGERRLHQVMGTLEATALEVVPVRRELALAAAHVKARHPLAYADAFAAALAQQTDATLVTGDPEFHPLEGAIRMSWLSQSE